MPNVGAPPAEKIEDRLIAAREQALMQGPTPELVQLEIELKKAQLMMQLQQIQMAAAGGQPPGGGPPGAGGPPGGPGGPQGEGGGGASPLPGGPREGRPPSGQKPPKMEPRGGGASGAPSRTVVSESG